MAAARDEPVWADGYGSVTNLQDNEIMGVA
jgi:hypothetical protein